MKRACWASAVTSPHAGNGAGRVGGAPPVRRAIGANSTSRATRSGSCRGHQARRHGAPGMGDQGDRPGTGLALDQLEHRLDLRGGLGRAAERWMAVGRHGHGAIAAALAEAREVEGPGVEATHVPVVEPGTAAEVEADRQGRREGGAMDIEHCRRAGSRLAADEERRAVARSEDAKGLLGHVPEIGIRRRPALRSGPNYPRGKNGGTRQYSFNPARCRHRASRGLRTTRPGSWRS